MDRDAQFVAQMVVPLGSFAPGETLPDGTISKGGEYYDCRYLLPSGNCAVYDIRPQVCRACPAYGPCEKPGCTLSGAELEEHRMATDQQALREQRRHQDAGLAQMTRDFDLSAQDNHAKYERAHFAVVGEGSRTAQERYRTHYEAIEWDK